MQSEESVSEHVPAVGPADGRHVTFSGELEAVVEVSSQIEEASEIGNHQGRLGFGYARLNAEQLDDWAGQDLSCATAHRSTEAQAAQEAAWEAGFNKDGRSHWSVREAVRLHANRFQHAVHDFGVARFLVRSAALAPAGSALTQMHSEVLENIAEAALGLGPVVPWVCAWPRYADRRGATVRIAVRKRPLLSFEHERFEWDCVEADAGHATMLCHDGRLARNGKLLNMTHRRYLLDQVWDESAGNKQVSADAMLPLLRWAEAGKNSTLLCYGQTGTGKTFTLGGCIERLTDHVAACVDKAEIQFFEVQGQKLCDLLCDRAEVQLRADAEGLFHLRGATRLSVGRLHGGADAMQAALQQALQLRASEATERNPLSSRSHAILVVWLQSGGMIRFVDLAGSERNYETERMTAAQHRESALINTSLMALKDCFRVHSARNRGETVARPPYRASRLTQCLRDCFEDQQHRFLLIATVSPASSDVIHTANTLKHAVMMAAPLEAATTQLSLSFPLGMGLVTRDVPVAEWTAREVVEWAASVERGRFAQLVLPPGLDGSGLLALSAQGLARLFEGDLRDARGQGEGTSWNVTGYEEGQGSGVVLGRALFAAVRREALSEVKRRRAPVESMVHSDLAARQLAGA